MPVQRSVSEYSCSFSALTKAVVHKEQDDWESLDYIRAFIKQIALPLKA